MVQLDNLSYADMLFLREDPRVRAQLLQRFQPVREAFSTLAALSDDAFLRYLVNARVIGFSLEGVIKEIIDTLFPPVVMVGSPCGLVLIDLCWNIACYYPSQRKLCYVPFIQARALTFLEDRVCAFITRDNCYGVLLLEEKGKVIYSTNHLSYGRVRQIMGAYMLSDSNSLYYVVLSGTNISFRLLSCSCAFIIETQSLGTYKRVSYRHLDGSSKIMFSYAEHFLTMETRSLPGANETEVRLHMMRRAWNKHGLKLPSEDITMYQWGFYRLFTYRNNTYIACDPHRINNFAIEEEEKELTKNSPQQLAKVDRDVIEVTTYLGGSRGSKFYGIRL